MTAVSKSKPKRPAKTPVDAPHVAVMDTTLRDGEQTPNVSYTPAEKLQLARMLLVDVEVDRIEIASTRVSAGELEAARAITRWARKARSIQNVEMLGSSDGKKSVAWICDAGGKVMNLLTKGSERHCVEQLRLTPAQHREEVATTIRYARRKRPQWGGRGLYLRIAPGPVKDDPTIGRQRRARRPTPGRAGPACRCRPG